ncbi:cell wall-binding repeat-containing protein [Rossellomorea arthrocnemi]
MKKYIMIITVLIGVHFLSITDKGQAAERISGPDRYHTAVEVSKDGWNTSMSIVLARGDNFPDALAGGPLAYSLDAPILLTKSTQLPEATKKEIIRLKAKKVVILGGTASVSSNVESQLKRLGLTIDRIAGKNRFDTAAQIAKRLPSNMAIIANGYSFPDALAVSPYASKNKIPILLTSPDSLNSETRNALSKKGQTIVVGGTAVIDNNVLKDLPNPERIAGKNRFETAQEINKELTMGTEGATIVNGLNFPDALSSSVLSAKKDQPLLLVKPNEYPMETAEFMDPFQSFDIVGGPAVINENLLLRATQSEKRETNTLFLPVLLEQGTSGIKRYNLLTEESTLLIQTSSTIKNVKESGDWVYFIEEQSGEIHRISKNGADLEKVYGSVNTPQVDEFEIDDQWIYFRNEYSSILDQSLFRMNLIGKNVIKIGNKENEKSITSMEMDKEYIYYYLNSGGLFKTRKDGALEQVLLEHNQNDAIFACDCSLALSGDYIATTILQDNWKSSTIFVKKDGSEIKTVHTNHRFADLYSQNYGYYGIQESKGDREIQYSIYRYSTNPLNNVSLFKQITLDNHDYVEIVYVDDHTILLRGLEYVEEKYQSISTFTQVNF